MFFEDLKPKIYNSLEDKTLMHSEILIKEKDEFKAL